MSNTSWSETGLTYYNTYSISGALLGTLGTVGRNSWVELDVTGKIAPGGVISIGGCSTSTSGADYDSRATGALAPQLVIATGTPPTTTTTTTSTTTSTTTT